MVSVKVMSGLPKDPMYEVFLEPLECEELDLSCRDVPATKKLSWSSKVSGLFPFLAFLLALANFTSVFISSLHSSVSVTSSCSFTTLISSVSSASLLARESSVTETSSHLCVSYDLYCRLRIALFLTPISKGLGLPLKLRLRSLLSITLFRLLARKSLARST